MINEELGELAAQVSGASSTLWLRNLKTHIIYPYK
jgi:hypothetical protein